VVTTSRHARQVAAVRALPPPLLLAAAGGRPRRARAGAAPAQGVRGAAASQRGVRRRVLVVDDEPSIRLLCRVNLGASGMDVLEASDGAEGLALAREERPDLVLLDVMMPGLDGWEVARQLAEDEATAAIPIVFLTARAEQADRVQGQSLGGVGYMLKPFDPVSLGDAIEVILDRLGRGEREQLRREMAGPGR
jgi:DNA-binding response OmpR family regulator